MGDLQCLRNISGNADLAAPTFLPTLRGRDRFVLVFPNLKRDAVDVIALSGQKCCRDRTVHSTAHAEENRWASHMAAIVLRREEKG
jgi:hypothetical protein